jgi:hypothetical protein
MANFQPLGWFCACDVIVRCDSIVLVIMVLDYESWLKQSNEQLALLRRQRDAIDDEIENLERAIEAFTPLAKSAWIGAGAGITESVRHVLSSKPEELFSPVGIRDELLLRGVRLGQKNAMATIHQVLARLVEKNLVVIEPCDGRNRYRWVGPGGRDDVVKKRTNQRKG